MNKIHGPILGSFVAVAVTALPVVKTNAALIFAEIASVRTQVDASSSELPDDEDELLLAPFAGTLESLTPGVGSASIDWDITAGGSGTVSYDLSAFADPPAGMSLSAELRYRFQTDVASTFSRRTVFTNVNSGDVIVSEDINSISVGGTPVEVLGLGRIGLSPGGLRGRSYFSVVAGESTELPGDSPSSPLPAISTNAILSASSVGNTIDSNVAVGTEVDGLNTGATFEVPVEDAGFGSVDTAWLDPELAAGYGYFVGGGNAITSFTIPGALPQGDSSFEIHHGGVVHQLTAGQTFDFTQIDPAGVESFLLLGIDDSELLVAGDEPHPFVFGMTFATEGIAKLHSFALISIPEPSTIAFLTLGLCGLSLAVRRRTAR